MPISDSLATELAQLLGSGTAGELIPELVRQGLQTLIEAEALGDIARAQGMTQVARESGLSRESLYKAKGRDDLEDGVKARA